MDRVKERLDDGLRALATPEKVIGLPKPSDVERDAAIQRFEYTFEMAWKAAQAYLTDREFLEAASPRRPFVVHSRLAYSMMILLKSS